MTPETQNVEWKRSWRDDYLARICGFANAQGGILEIGKDDKGAVVGVRNVLSLLEDIPSKVQSLLGIVVEVNLKSESGLEYIEIVVEPHSNPISYRGKFHYRSGSTKQVLQGAALSRFLLEKHGRTWDDVALPGIKLSDLDGRAFAQFRQLGVKRERLPPEALDDSNEDVIERLRLRAAALLKRAAALLFHPSPHRFFMGAHVKIDHFRGPELIYRDVIEGDLFTQVDRTLDLLYTKYTRGLIAYEGIYRVETFPVPRGAMREAVINAVIHRDYARQTSTQIHVYDDRITIRNPTELPVDWRASATGGMLSEPHNPRVAHAFFRAGLVEAWGRGIHQIRERCRESGNPTPLWTREPGGVLCLRFAFSEAYKTADAEIRAVAVERDPSPEDHRQATEGQRTGPKTGPNRAPRTDRQGSKIPLPQAARGRCNPARRFIQSRALESAMTDLLTQFLAGQGHDPAIIAKALDKLDKAAALGGGTALYDANPEVYGLLRYGAKVRPGLGEPAMRHLLDTYIRAEGSEGGRRSLVPLGCLHGASPLSAARFVSAPVAQPG